jgi:hypothetical protein
MGKPAGFSGYADGSTTTTPFQALAQDASDVTKKVNIGAMVGETFTAQDATPSIATRANLYTTANSSGTTITAFDGGTAGQIFCVVAGDANTTIDFTGSSIKGNAGADKTLAAGDTLICIHNGTNAYCAVIDATT